MTMQHLPRPWMLAALTDMPVTLLARQHGKDSDTGWQEETLPRPDERRRRLGAPPGWCDRRPGEDAWGGTGHWREVEVDRAA